MSTSSLRRNRCQQQAERNVFRLKNSMPNKFEEMVLSSLGKAVTMTTQEIDSQVNRKSPEKVTLKRKSSRLSFYRKSIKKREFTQLTPDSISALTVLIEFIGKSYNIKDEGLFRKTGNISRQKTVRKQLLECSMIDLELISSHDGANVLKNFIRDLCEPLLTNRFHNVYTRLASLLTTEDKAKPTTLKALQMLMLLMPSDNYCLLRPLITLLHRTSKTPENLMAADSLAIIFTPHFLCNKSSSGTELQTTTKTFCHLVAFMIESGNNLFKIPQDLAEEVSSFWKEMEIPNHLYLQSVTKKNRPLKTLDDSVLTESPKLTPKKKSGRRSLVHVIDLGISPDKRRKSGLFSPRHRQSSESSDASLPERRPLPDIVVSKVDEKCCTAKNQSEQRQWNFPPSTTKNKPVAMVKPISRSPISQFFRNVPQQLQKVMQTPRSRTPMLYRSPQLDMPHLDMPQLDLDDDREIMC